MRRLLTIATIIGSLVAGTVTAATPAAAMTIAQLQTAQVPSMCDNPAGTLVDGELPNIPGVVSLDEEHSRTGTLIKGDGKGAVATFNCSAGGIGWADHLVFYDAAGRIIGHFDTGTLGIGGSSRANVHRVSITSRKVSVRVLGVPRNADNDLWGSTGATVTFRFDARSKTMTQRSVVYDTENATAKRLLSLVRAGKTSSARKLAAKDVVATLREMAVADAKSKDVTVRLTECGGPYLWGDDNSWFIDLYRDAQRGCIFTIEHKTTTDTYSSAYLVLFAHPDSDLAWARWYGRAIVGVAG